MTSRQLLVLATITALAAAGCAAPTPASTAPSPTTAASGVPQPSAAAPTTTPTRAPVQTAASTPKASVAAPGASVPSPTGVLDAPLPQGSEPVVLDPARFVSTIDNPYWPMSVGSRWVYRETDAEGAVQRVEVTVTDQKKQILGIDATVVHDVVTEDGEVVEDTFDWYAQDVAGNVWYLGESTQEFDGGEVSTAGSWEAGVDGAQPGILLPGRPMVGQSYRQEYLAGEAEDAAQVLSLDERAEVPFGRFTDVLLTKDYTPLEPDVLEYKFYAPGVGQVMAIGVSGGFALEELLEYEAGG